MSPRDEKSNIIAITSIRTEDGNSYTMPEEFMYIGAHEELKKTDIFTKVKTKLRYRHDEVSVWVILTDELRPVYMDEAGNIEFKGYLLDKTKESEKEKSDLEKILEKLLEASKEKEEEKNVKHIADKFIIEKLSSKDSNAKQWMEIFEKECIRFKITKDNMKIEILRLFLEKSYSDWYRATTTKLSINNNWREWKDRFLESFADKEWSTWKYALAFRYKEGPLIDYAIKKERLILDVNKDIDSKTLIALITTGLPEFIMNRISKEEVQDSTTLFNEIRNYESMVERKNIKTRDGKQDWKKKYEEKKPCKTCEGLNKGTRYHPEDKCWFKIKEAEKKNNTSSIVGKQFGD